MGVTIHYRGKIDDPGRIEEFEDRVTDLVFALGGRATVWRSFADHDPSRVVRGLIVEMAPGQESLSLLVSPEGDLLSLVDIEDAEKGPFPEPPYVFVKTQFGSVHGHIAIVHLLDAIKQHYSANLVISDEGDYYQERDLAKLAEKMRRNAAAIQAMGKSLEEFGLSAEAMEDPEIVALRVERVARLVQQKMQGTNFESNQNPGDDSSGDSEWAESTLEEEVEFMDRLRRKNQLRGERMNRRIQEAIAGGMTTGEALELAMKEEGIFPSFAESADEADEAAMAEPDLPALDNDDFGEYPDDHTEREDHPAVVLATQFLTELRSALKKEPLSNMFTPMAMQGAMEMMGGLVQATCSEHDDRILRALAISQLKRALKGHAFARGALFGLRSAGSIDEQTSHHLHNQLETLLTHIHDLTASAWDEPEFQ